MTKMSTYEERRAQARQEAIDWQQKASEESMSWGEIADAQDYFEALGRRYGLLAEFRENGIC